MNEQSQAFMQPAKTITESVPRLTVDKAFLFLFSVSFGPGFMAINYAYMALDKPWVTGTIIGYLVLAYFLNRISIWMLTDVYKHSRLGSYQEVAYVSSQGNVGYIYLICIIKGLYLILTAAFCMEYIANYLTNLCKLAFVD